MDMHDRSQMGSYETGGNFVTAGQQIAGGREKFF